MTSDVPASKRAGSAGSIQIPGLTCRVGQRVVEPASARWMECGTASGEAAGPLAPPRTVAPVRVLVAARRIEVNATGSVVMGDAVVTHGIRSEASVSISRASVARGFGKRLWSMRQSR